MMETMVLVASLSAVAAIRLLILPSRRRAGRALLHLLRLDVPGYAILSTSGKASPVELALEAIQAAVTQITSSRISSAPPTMAKLTA
jgi:hypothetical protein